VDVDAEGFGAKGVGVRCGDEFSSTGMGVGGFAVVARFNASGEALDLAVGRLNDEGLEVEVDDLLEDASSFAFTAGFAVFVFSSESSADLFLPRSSVCGTQGVRWDQIPVASSRQVR
jgi:hypothetical protein